MLPHILMLLGYAAGTALVDYCIGTVDAIDHSCDGEISAVDCQTQNEYLPVQFIMAVDVGSSLFGPGSVAAPPLDDDDDPLDPPGIDGNCDDCGDPLDPPGLDGNHRQILPFGLLIGQV